MESKFRWLRPLRAQPWLPFNHAAKGHVTAAKLPLFPSFSSLLFRGPNLPQRPPSIQVASMCQHLNVQGEFFII